MRYLSYIAVLMVIVSAPVVFAWTGPTQAPPGGNVSSPVHVGSGNQTKAGSIGVDAPFIVFDPNSVNTWFSVCATGACTGNTGIGTVNPTHRLDVQGGAIRQTINTTYDVWYQGGASTAGGDLRNLAILGTDEDSGDTLYVNYNGEYEGGTRLGGNVYAAGYFHTSDARLKKDIHSVQGLDIITRLRGVGFTWKDSNVPSLGLIAQEVEQVLPNAVITDNEGIKAVDYDALIAPLIEAVKEQQAEIESLRYELELLKADR